MAGGTFETGSGQLGVTFDLRYGRMFGLRLFLPARAGQYPVVSKIAAHSAVSTIVMNFDVRRIYEVPSRSRDKDVPVCIVSLRSADV